MRLGPFRSRRVVARAPDDADVVVPGATKEPTEGRLKRSSARLREF